MRRGNWFSALQWMEQGFAVRREGWSLDPASDEFNLPLRSKPLSGYVYSVQGPRWLPVLLKIEDYRANDWMIVEE